MSDFEDRVLRVSDALKLLARDKGVQREDKELLALFDGDLSILRDTWSIDTRRGPKNVRDTAVNKILSVVDHMPPRSYRPQGRLLNEDHRKGQFKTVVSVIFNLRPGFDKHQGRRYAWLEHEARGDMQINATAAREDFYYAVARIARHYAGTTNPAPTHHQAKAELIANPQPEQSGPLPVIGPEPSAQSTPQPADTKKPRNRRTVALSLAGIVVAAAVIIPIALSGSNTDNDQPTPPSGTSNPIAIEFVESHR